MAPQNELSMREYARFNGISHNYLEGHSSFQPEVLHTLLAGTRTTEDFDLETSAIPSVDLDLVTKEKISLDGAARMLLSSAAALRYTPPILDLPDRHKPRLKALKFEVPLLKTDNELDYIKALRRSGSDATVHNFPSLPIDEQKGEGLVWPASYEQLKHKFDEACRTEKLSASRHAIQLLKNTLALQYSQDAQTDVVAADLAYSKNAALEPFTSPLLPLTPEKPLPPLPSSTISLSQESTNTISLSDELKCLERRLFNCSPPRLSMEAYHSQCQPKESEMYSTKCMISDLGTYTQAEPSYSPLRTKREDLKVDGPLTPLHKPRPLKDIVLSDAAKDFDLLFSPIEKETGINSDEDYYAFLEQLEPFGRDANQILENEQLVLADTVARVKVPTLLHQADPPPWRVVPSKSQHQRDIQAVTLPVARMGLHHWKGVAKLERELQWSPFPMDLAKVAVDEKIDHSNIVASFLILSGPKDKIAVENPTWKRDGLRILDDVDEDEEVLQMAPRQDPSLKQITSQKHTQSLGDNRYSLPEAETEPLSRMSIASRLQAHTPQAATSLVVPTRNETPKPNRGEASIFSNTFSASQKLDMYMDLRGGRLPKRPPRESSSALNPGSKHIPATTFHAEHDVDRVKRLKVQHPTGPYALKSSQDAFVLPKLPAYLPPRSVIISSHVLTNHRSFIRALTALYPNIEMIERDFSCIHIQQSKDPQEIPFTSDEADITISPGTGILITTLQKIKQQPLPGQARHRTSGNADISRQNIRDRIANVAPKYQRLHVLVSAGNLETPDMAALLELLLFASGIDAGITVDFVPGDDHALARWVACLIATTSLPASMEDVKLLVEETLWEVFLRRAGMNAYGAQAVLAEMKSLEQGSGNCEDTTSLGGDELGMEYKRSKAVGLPAFALMTAKDRMKKFERLLEGKDILTKVNEALDMSWI